MRPPVAMHPNSRARSNREHPQPGGLPHEAAEACARPRARLPRSCRPSRVVVALAISARKGNVRNQLLSAPRFSSSGKLNADFRVRTCSCQLYDIGRRGTHRARRRHRHLGVHADCQHLQRNDPERWIEGCEVVGVAADHRVIAVARADHDGRVNDIGAARAPAQGTGGTGFRLVERYDSDFGEPEEPGQAGLARATGHACATTPAGTARSAPAACASSSKAWRRGSPRSMAISAPVSSVTPATQDSPSAWRAHTRSSSVGGPASAAISDNSVASCP